MKDRIDRFVAALARLVLRIFYQRIEIEGADRIPHDRPLLILANHPNSLIDPLLVLGFLDVRARFLAKSTLWQVPGLRRLLDLAGAIPVYRRKDPGVDTGRNVETFARCHETLAGGGCIALFPEGISHGDPRLAPFKTGAARIALETEAAHGPLGLRIVPVGLTFERRGAFRSRVLVRVGEALDPAPECAQHDAEPREAVRGLTERLREAFEAVTLNYPSWERARLVERAAEVAAVPEKAMPARLALTEAFALRRGVSRATQALASRHPERLRRLAETVERYQARLSRLDLRDDHVAARYPREEIALYVVGSVSLLLFWLPLATLGALLTGAPALLLAAAARLQPNRDVDATLKVFGGLALFPLAWLGEAAWAGWHWGAPAFGAALVLAPFAGWVAVLFVERYQRLLDEARAFLLLKLRRRTRAELQAERERIRREMDALITTLPHG